MLVEINRTNVYVPQKYEKQSCYDKVTPTFGSVSDLIS